MLAMMANGVGYAGYNEQAVWAMLAMMANGVYPVPG